MKRMLLGGGAVIAGAILVVALLRVSDGVGVSSPETVTSETPAVAVPILEVDPSWPMVPEGWILGEVSSIGVDAEGNILVLHRPRSVQLYAPDSLSFAAPPVLEFDASGTSSVLGAVRVRGSNGLNESTVSMSTITETYGSVATTVRRITRRGSSRCRMIRS